MPQHTVKLTKIPELKVGKKDMRFEIEGDGNAKIGTLLVSKGGIEWRPYKKQKRLLSWEKFDQRMRDHWGDRGFQRSWLLGHAAIDEYPLAAFSDSHYPAPSALL